MWPRALYNGKLTVPDEMILPEIGDIWSMILSNSSLSLDKHSVAESTSMNWHFLGTPVPGAHKNG